VIWVGVKGEIEPLQRLQEAIEAAMEELGFQREGRPFHPHLTLGRVNRRAGGGYRRKLGEALQAYEVGEVGNMRVEEVALMRSQLHPKGAIYTQLAVHRLRDA
jgi:2'-5' RNA ligase